MDALSAIHFRGIAEGRTACRGCPHCKPPVMKSAKPDHQNRHKTEMERDYLRGFKRPLVLDSRLYRDPVALPALLRHMELYYSDRHIVEDLDSVLSCCGSDEDRDAVKRYAKLRRRAPRFAPKSWTSNNDQFIAADQIGRPCGKCGVRFTPKRSTARFCSARCRKGASRGGHVTLSPSEHPA